MLHRDQENMDARGDSNLASAVSGQEAKESSSFSDVRQRRSVSTEGDEAEPTSQRATGSSQNSLKDSPLPPPPGNDRLEVPPRATDQSPFITESDAGGTRPTTVGSAQSQKKLLSLDKSQPPTETLKQNLKASTTDLPVTSYSSLEKKLKLEVTPSDAEGEPRALRPRSLSPDDASESLGEEDEDEEEETAEDEAVSRDKTNNSHPPKVIVTTTAESPARTSGRAKTNSLRRGKWTVEEEAYVARVIQDFNSGFLDAPAGTTLRTYLSAKLQCDPMRITKKFTGDACIGKRVFHPAVRTPSNSVAIDISQAELETLAVRWRRRLEMQQRESAKKAFAARARAASFDGTTHGSKQNVVAQTASWLDRAKSVLKEPTTQATPESAPSSDLQETDDLETQMHEVQRLIREGPTIQQTSAVLPEYLDDVAKDHAAADDQSVSPGNSVNEPADKRLRTAEDAEALVGFLRSVRASAASGNEI